MKYLLIILFPFLLHSQDGSTLHFYAGFGITMISGSIIYHYTENTTLSCLSGLGTGILAGLGKEYIWDRKLKRGVFGKEDYLTTGWGAFVGTIVLRCSIDIVQKKRTRNKYFY